jgi:hypothetical protein
MADLFVAAQNLFRNLATRMLIQLVQLIKMIFDVAGTVAVRSAAFF